MFVKYPSSLICAANGENDGTFDSSSMQKDCTEEGCFRNPNDCTRFYRCLDPSGGGQFVKFDFSCPEELVFDETYDICSFPNSNNLCS